MIFRPALLASVAILVACGSASEPAGPTAPAPVTTATAPNESPDAAPPAANCAPPPSKSTCGESAWVRGTAHFDASRLQAGSKPVLRVVLRHGFALVKGEETIGGRLHEWASFPVTDPTRGEIAFAIDMCASGTSMWSEENGAFHLVLILDENGDNNLDDATSNETAIVIGTPSKGEYVKMMDVDVSCKATAPACVEATLDCTGESCLAIQPVKSCSKKLPGCNSDSAFCN